MTKTGKGTQKLKLKLRKNDERTLFESEQKCFYRQKSETGSRRVILHVQYSKEQEIDIVRVNEREK